jgi:glycosyltransferase involved in cell wall biosynthesis
MYRPEYVSGLRYFDYNKLVFDIYDDLASFKQDDIDKFNYIKSCKEDLAKKSDLVIVTASTLLDIYKSMSKKICLIPNGYDLNLFASRDLSVPDDIRKTRKPIIGFIGTLFSFLDYNLLEYIIKSNPKRYFVFIGALEEDPRVQWENITNKYNNVFWLGKKKKEDIPAYLDAFDVCINPFKIDAVSRSVSPLKVFEYLAMKKPVVSVRMESLEKEEIAPFIYFASSYQEFDEKLNEAINEKETFQDKLDYRVVMKYSWDNLFEKVQNALRNI